MTRTIQSALRAVRSLLTPGIPGLLMLCALLSLGVLLALLGAAAWGLNAFILKEQAAQAFLALSLIESVAAVILAMLLFPIALPLIVSFFDDRIADAIETHEYGNVPLPQPQPFWNELWHDIKFSLWALFLNVVSLPIYFIPALNAVWFFVLNGCLLGRQFFVMIAARHMSRGNAAALVVRHRLPIYAGGIIITLCATIPFVNLAAPFWGVALMVHLFHLLYPLREAETSRLLA